METPIKKEIVDGLVADLGITDFAKATIREVKQVAAKAEKQSGVGEDQTSPVLVFFLFCQLQPQCLGFLDQHLAVFCIESAEDQTGAWCHLPSETLHISEQNITVDIGQHEIEASFHLI